jgi:hypothetical protein
MKMVELRPDLRMVLDDGRGQAYLLRRGSEAVLIDTGIADKATRSRPHSGTGASTGMR